MFATRGTILANFFSHRRTQHWLSGSFLEINFPSRLPLRRQWQSLVIDILIKNSLCMPSAYRFSFQIVYILTVVLWLWVKRCLNFLSVNYLNWMHLPIRSRLRSTKFLSSFSTQFFLSIFNNSSAGFCSQ